MRLLACHIDNFGKLSNFNLDFQSGINIINARNGWGKSTLAAFLKAMLYGFDNKREEGSFEKERVVYNPWQGGTYGGTLDIEVADKRYRILRTFGNSEKYDTFQLIDLATNLESVDYTSAIGVELFDLDRASFRKTIYIAQNDCVGGTSDTINAKLGNLAASTNDINNFETAMSILREQMNRLSPNRITGSIKRRKNTITELEQEIKGLDAAQEASEKLQEKLQQKQKMVSEMSGLRHEYSKALQLASEEASRKERRLAYQNLCEEVETKDKALDYYRTVFPNGVPNAEGFEKCQNAINQLEEAQTTVRNMKPGEEELEELARLKEMFAPGIPEDEVIDEMLDKAQSATRSRLQHSKLETRLAQMEAQSLQEQSEEPFAPVLQKSVLQPIGIVLGALGLVSMLGALIEYKVFGIMPSEILFKLSIMFGVLQGIAGLILVEIGVRQNRNFANRVELRKEAREQMKISRERPIQEIRSELRSIEETILQIEQDLAYYLQPYEKLNRQASYQEQLYELRAQKRSYLYIKGKAATYEDACDQCQYLEEKLKKFTSVLNIPYGPDMQNALTQLQSRAAECYLAKNAAEYALSRKHRFENLYDMEVLMSDVACPYSLDELNTMIHETDEGLEHLRASVNQYRRQIEDLQEQLDLRDEKEQELCAERIRQQEDTDSFDTYNLTRQYLQAARDQFLSKYMGPITRAFSRYYEQMTGETSSNWLIDTNMNLKLKEQGQLRETKWLSAGNQDLMGICMRLALVEAMYPAEKPFLIFDDPFVNLDDEKLANGRKLLDSLAREYQMIYFTCVDSRR